MLCEHRAGGAATRRRYDASKPSRERDRQGVAQGTALRFHRGLVDRSNRLADTQARVDRPRRLRSDRGARHVGDRRTDHQPTASLQRQRSRGAARTRSDARHYGRRRTRGDRRVDRRRSAAGGNRGRVVLSTGSASGRFARICPTASPSIGPSSDSAWPRRRSCCWPSRWRSR